MDQRFEALGNEDVLSTSGSNLMFQCTFKVSELMDLLQTKLEEESLFTEGLECEVLSPGKYWRRGKVQLRLEFCPEDSNPAQNHLSGFTEPSTIKHE
ncbi:KGK domain-containing protein [Oscillatoria sp. HE19RPO]|uniref:KGK domain-containing protein n=1 Tax=Oscillatoria sp. HE19RPO TaxID=2954806 RepID=UPI0020C4AA2A|nr:KGK domain-containing protein [Oscillatoria sp. HE19RPO]